jgi:hypothetical protein
MTDRYEDSDFVPETYDEKMERWVLWDMSVQDLREIRNALHAAVAAAERFGSDVNRDDWGRLQATAAAMFEAHVQD